MPWVTVEGCRNQKKKLQANSRTWLEKNIQKHNKEMIGASRMNQMIQEISPRSLAEARFNSR
jgi:hypothetical protein